MVWLLLPAMCECDARRSASLCTGAGSNLRDRALGEIEKNSLMALPGRLCPQNNVYPLGEDSGSFTVTFQRWISS